MLPTLLLLLFIANSLWFTASFRKVPFIIDLAILVNALICLALFLWPEMHIAIAVSYTPLTLATFTIFQRFFTLLLISILALLLSFRQPVLILPCIPLMTLIILLILWPNLTIATTLSIGP